MESSLRNIILAIVFLCLTPAVHAEGEEELNLYLEDLLNVNVSSATKMEQKVEEAPGISTVIKREQIKDYGWLSLNEMLYTQAGFFPGQDYDRRTVGSRGLFEGWNNNHLLMLMDGVPVNDPMYGSAYTWEITPVAFMKSVEITRGPGSALYGTNATNGLLSIKTLSGSDMHGRSESSLRLGSEAHQQLDVITGKSGEQLSYFLGYSRMSTNGFGYESYDGTGLLKHTRDDRASDYLFFKLQGNSVLKDWEFQFHNQSWDFQTGHGWLFSIPDVRESMKERRQIASLSYKPSSGALSSEYVLQYQHKNIDWNTQYYPEGTAGYPDGVWEYVNFDHDQIFARAQWSYVPGDFWNLLGGIEASGFLYDGDNAHLSNTVLNDASYGAQPGNAYRSVDGILELIQDKPLINYGVFAQGVMNFNAAGMKAPLTLGVRYDSSTVNFDGTQTFNTTPGTGDEERKFDQVSPRLALVLIPNDDLSVKVLAGKAFRAPAPSELAGTNTWALANDIRSLKPEEVTTFELGGTFKPRQDTRLRLNLFRTEFENEIFYNFSQFNRSNNIYSATTQGVEAEAYYVAGRLSGFANLSWTQRVDEEVTDTTIAAAEDEVTWAPSLTGNLGLSAKMAQDLTGAIILSHLGEQKRRTSDIDPVLSNLREDGGPEAAWRVDTNWSYKLSQNFMAEFRIYNLLDEKSKLVKNRANQFDYQREGRSFIASISASAF